MTNSSMMNNSSAVNYSIEFLQIYNSAIIVLSFINIWIYFIAYIAYNELRFSLQLSWLVVGNCILVVICSVGLIAWSVMGLKDLQCCNLFNPSGGFCFVLSNIFQICYTASAIFVYFQTLSKCTIISSSTPSVNKRLKLIWPCSSAIYILIAVIPVLYTDEHDQMSWAYTKIVCCYLSLLTVFLLITVHTVIAIRLSSKLMRHVNYGCKCIQDFFLSWTYENEVTGLLYLNATCAILFTIDVLIVVWANKNFRKHFRQILASCCYGTLICCGIWDINATQYTVNADDRFKHLPIYEYLRKLSLEDAIGEDQAVKFIKKTLAQPSRRVQLERGARRLAGCLVTPQGDGGSEPETELQTRISTMDDFIHMNFDPIFQIFPDRVEFTSVRIDSGAYGIVEKAYFKTLDNKKVQVAVKTIKDDSDEVQQNWLRELKLMTEIGRTQFINVMFLLGVVINQEARLAAVFEFCEFGSLKNYIIKNKQKFRLFNDYLLATEMANNDPAADCQDQDQDQPGSSRGNYARPDTVVQESSKDDECITELDLIFYAYQIARGMAFYLHKVIHRDLALRNVLLSKHKVAKISDFGCARRCEVSKNTKQEIPYKWMAPEALAYLEFSAQSDVWSFGVVLWEIFSLGSDPYPLFSTPEEVYNYLKHNNRMEAPKHCPRDVTRLMFDCWMEDKTIRPAFTTCQVQLVKAAHLISSANDWQIKLYLLEAASIESEVDLKPVWNTIVCWDSTCMQYVETTLKGINPC